MDAYATPGRSEGLRLCRLKSLFRFTADTSHLGDL
jgi:hypothetical protein